ncbi:hypothetical protein ABIF96_005762 [Bradyrhizobium ottawaense]|uniref:hypothetical protein n=1 Tax=Bradyrhizobium ottawaense TaxID=931866 RepID=UPI003837A910
MSEIQSGDSSVRDEIAIVAGPRGWGDTRESWLARVPRRVKSELRTKTETLTFRLVKALWYGEITDPDHWAARDIRRAAELIEARKEASAMADRFQQIAGGMRDANSNLYSEEIDRLEHIARIISGLDRS